MSQCLCMQMWICTRTPIWLDVNTCKPCFVILPQCGLLSMRVAILGVIGADLPWKTWKRISITYDCIEWWHIMTISFPNAFPNANDGPICLSTDLACHNITASDAYCVRDISSWLPQVHWWAVIGEQPGPKGWTTLGVRICFGIIRYKYIEFIKFIKWNEFTSHWN